MDAIAKLVPLYDDSVAYSHAFSLYASKIIMNNLNTGISIVNHYTMLMYSSLIAARLCSPRARTKVISIRGQTSILG